MTWNYRIGKKTVEYEFDGRKESEDIYGIYEAYYNDDGEIYATTVEGMEPHGETLEELKSDFEMMQEAFNKEVLDLDTIKYAKNHRVDYEE